MDITDLNNNKSIVDGENKLIMDSLKKNFQEFELILFMILDLKILFQIY